MKIKYRDIILRDMEGSDIEDWVRWNTIETEWMDWDGPDLPCDPFDEVLFRKECADQLSEPPVGIRNTFELDTADGVHLGMVSSYLTDENFEHLSRKDAKDTKNCYHTLGILICESRHWSRGLGRQALTAFCKYCLDNGITAIRLQTWSGNVRMIRCAQRIGFVECNRFSGNRHIRGKVYDGLTFQLDLDRFRYYMEEESAV